MSTAKKKPLAGISKPPVSQSDLFTWNIKKMYVLLILLVVILYGNTVLNDYSLDDSLDIYENVNVAKGFDGIPEILTSPFVVTEYYKFDYRPLSPITFAVEKEIFGFNPHISHIINLLLYIACVLLLFSFLRKVTGYKSPQLVFVIAVIFAIHPLHTEVVASLKNRQELLSFLFGFLSLNLLYDCLTSVDIKWNKLLLSFLFFVLALFSKLASLPFLFFLIYLLFTVPSSVSNYGKFGITLLFLSAPVLFILFTKKWLFRPFYFDENPLVVFSSLSYKIGTTLHVFLVYLKMLFFPYPMSFYYGYDTIKVIQAYHPLAILSLLIFAAIVVFAIKNCLKKNTVGLFGLFFIASLMMYNNITFTYPGLLSDRAMFLPSAWFIALVVLGSWEFIVSKRISVNKYAGYTVLLLLTIGSSLYVIKRNTQWKTQVSIMEADINHLQNSTLANYYYAWTLESELRKSDNSSNANLLEISKNYYHKSLELGIRVAEPYYRLAMFSKYYDNNTDSSVFYLKKYIAADTFHTKAYYELADSYFKEGKFADAALNYQKVYEMNPADTLNLFYYVQAEYMTKGVEPALKLNARLAQLAPKTQYPYMNFGTLFKESGKIELGYIYLDSAVFYGCTNQQLIHDLYSYFLKSNNSEKIKTYSNLLKQ